MRIGLVSEKFIENDVEFNINQMIETLEQSIYKHIDLLLFGEAFLQGFGALTADYEKDMAMAFKQDDPRLQRLKDTCRKTKTALAFGYIEKEEGILYSSCMVISGEGEVIKNIRRFSEGWKLDEAFQDERYQEGTDYSAFNYAGKTITCAICGDLWHDHLLEKLNAVKSDVLLWPLYTNYEIDFWNEGEREEYALQAGKLQRPVLMVNSIDEGEYRSYGGAYVFENGEVQQELLMGEAGILIYEF